MPYRRYLDMTDNNLITTLCADLTPVRQHSIQQQLLVAGVAGGSISFAALLATLGVQPGLASMAGIMPLAIKAGFAASIAAVGLAATIQLARPDGAPTNTLQKVAAIIVLLASIALVQAGYTHDVGQSRLLLGASWQSCSLRIAALSIPITAALGWIVRQQAPVRLRQAGGAVGLAGGATAAALYALACTETSSAFVLVWYSAGIALSTAIGATLGPRLLRW
jgi:hypothetical protein